MRPVLNPALRLVWRSPTSLQLGVDPRHRVVLEGLTVHGETVLALLDGTRDVGGVLATAAALGIAAADAEAMLDLLLRSGALEDASVATALPADARDRLSPELAELSLLAPPGGAATTLARRRQRTALVVGCGRLGTAVAALLAAAGVGRLLLRDEQDTTRADLPAGGSGEAVLGMPRALAAARVASAAGETRVDAAVRRPSDGDCADADLVVVTGDVHTADDDALREQLATQRVPWLLAGVRETCGVVGPLVLPGRSACPRCLDLTRADRDPTWPAVAAQLRSARQRRVEAGSAALVSVTAGLATAEALSFLAGPAAPQCVDTTLEVRAPEWSTRRRAWPPHPDCGCAAAPGALAG